MGGDDLGSDDEYLAAPVRDDKGGENSSTSKQEGQEDTRGASKRKRDNNNDSPSNDDDGPAPSSKKQKNLSKLSRNLLASDKEEQAAFLSAALTHYTQMSVEDDGDSTKQQTNLPSVERIAKCLTHPKERAASTTTYDHYKTSFFDRLLMVMNKKRLKRHTSSSTAGSPSVLIVCQSARRAVALLKECTPLKTKAAKLFPKQGSVSQQAGDLATQRYGLAVGTPHRLLALADQGALSLQSTQLVVLDAAASSKNYTVCTLPDTAQDCMKFVRNVVLSDLLKRSNIKLVFC